MINFDYSAPAELFAAHGRKGLRYRRFAKAAEAIQYALEKKPVVALPTTSIEVDDARYDAGQIRALYYDVSYPLARKGSGRRSASVRQDDPHRAPHPPRVTDSGPRARSMLLGEACRHCDQKLYLADDVLIADKAMAGAASAN